MSDSYKIFVINLPDSHERRASIEAQFQGSKLPMEIFPATVGKNLSDEDIKARSTEQIYYYYQTKDWCTKGFFGCLESHHRIYRRIEADGLDFAVVLEDDVELTPMFFQHLEKVIAEMTADEIVLLFYQGAQIKLQKGSKKSISEKSQVSIYEFASESGIGSTAGYIIPRQVAARMLEVQSPIKFGPDWWPDFVRSGVCKRLRGVYPLMVQVALFESTVGYVERGALAKAKRIVQHIPVAKQILAMLLKRRRQKYMQTQMAYEFVDA